MAIGINTALRNMFLDNTLDAAFNSGTMEIRSGTQPVSPNDVATGTVLATIALPANAFAPAAAGSAALSASIQDVAADATGTATWCRIRNTGDTIRLDGDVAVAGAFCNLDSVAIQIGGQVTITSMTLTMPE